MHRERRSTVPGAVVWTSTPGGRGTGPGAGLVLPDGCMDLLWRSDTREVLVAGPDTAAFASPAAPGVTWTGLRLSPGHAPAFLGVPAAELRDTHVRLADLWGEARARRLAERVEQVGGAPGAGLEALVAGVPRDAALVHAARSLGSGHPVAEVADELGVGARTLHRRSLAAFGYAPQVLARVLRFRRAVALLRAGAPPARVAAEAGYADQAHLSREVRSFAGTTPSALRPPAQPSGAKRSTAPPSGSSTVA